MMPPTSVIPSVRKADDRMEIKVKVEREVWHSKAKSDFNLKGWVYH